VARRLGSPAYTETKPPSATLDRMSYALVEDVATTWESYERLAAELERSLPAGLILHAAGPTDEGVRIIEVWESEEAWSAFADAVDRPSDDRFAAAPRSLRDLRPSHLVFGRELT
jgi:hypothetical protein